MLELSLVESIVVILAHSEKYVPVLVPSRDVFFSDHKLSWRVYAERGEQEWKSLASLEMPGRVALTVWPGRCADTNQRDFRILLD